MSKTSPPTANFNQIPADIHCAQDYELLAPRFIAAPTFAHIAGGSGHDVTVDANRATFSEWSIWPRLLQNVTAGHTRLTMFDREFLHPILLAPVAHQKLVHLRGELETAHAAAAMHSCMICSTLSSFSLEDIGDAALSDKWFQLYFQPQREITLDLLRRAERAGYTAIVVTLDTPIQAQSLRSRCAAFVMPDECVAVNLQHYPQPQPINLNAGQSRVLQGMMSEAPTWQDLDWLLSQTSLPVLVKGVLHADDARELQMRGAAGLVVSNHGGRSLDGAPPSLRALPAIRAAVGSGYPLLLDSGIRSGSDIFKALALGADAVLIGRLQVYALSVAGALGVAHLLKLLREELEICMALAGCATLSDISQAALEMNHR